MLKSMTAFGSAKKVLNGSEITVEIKSVNNRYFDCQVRCPRNFSCVEQKVKPFLNSCGVMRGKVEVNISQTLIGDVEKDTVNIFLNIDYAKKYVQALKKLQTECDVPGEITIMDLAKNQDIFTLSKNQSNLEDTWENLFGVLDTAAKDFLNGRIVEGERIQKDLLEKMTYIESLTEKIKEFSQKDIDGYKTRLEEKLRAVLSDNNITMDENRILTECAIYADRVSIDEEIVRLQSHYCGFFDYLKQDVPVGRSLDFLIQEINRETNTIGSKCNHFEISKLVLEVKTELEKVREQIQNIE